MGQSAEQNELIYRPGPYGPVGRETPEVESQASLFNPNSDECNEGELATGAPSWTAGSESFSKVNQCKLLGRAQHIVGIH